MAAAARRATRAREATAARRRARGEGGTRGGRGEDEVCVICYGPVVEAVEVRVRWSFCEVDVVCVGGRCAFVSAAGTRKRHKGPSI